MSLSLEKLATSPEELAMSPRKKVLSLEGLAQSPKGLVLSSKGLASSPFLNSKLAIQFENMESILQESTTILWGLASILGGLVTWTSSALIWRCFGETLEGLIAAVPSPLSLL